MILFHTLITFRRTGSHGMNICFLYLHVFNIGIKEKLYLQEHPCHPQEVLRCLQRRVSGWKQEVIYVGRTFFHFYDYDSCAVRPIQKSCCTWIVALLSSLSTTVGSKHIVTHPVFQKGLTHLAFDWLLWHFAVTDMKWRLCTTAMATCHSTTQNR